MLQCEVADLALDPRPVERDRTGAPREAARSRRRHWNAGASPFIRVKSADEILAKAVHRAPASSESGH